MYNSEQVKELLKKQRENCKCAYLRYYAGSEEYSAPQCVVDDIENAPEPEDFVLNDKRNVARGEEKLAETKNAINNAINRGIADRSFFKK